MHYLHRWLVVLLFLVLFRIVDVEKPGLCHRVALWCSNFLCCSNLVWVRQSIWTPLTTTKQGWNLAGSNNRSCCFTIQPFVSSTACLGSSRRTTGNFMTTISARCGTLRSGSSCLCTTALSSCLQAFTASVIHVHHSVGWSISFVPSHSMVSFRTHIRCTLLPTWSIPICRCNCPCSIWS